MSHTITIAAATPVHKKKKEKSSYDDNDCLNRHTHTQTGNGRENRQKGKEREREDDVNEEERREFKRLEARLSVCATHCEHILIKKRTNERTNQAERTRLFSVARRRPKNEKDVKGPQTHSEFGITLLLLLFPLACCCVCYAQ